MPRTGRPPNPKKVHKRRGNPSKINLDFDEPEGPEGVPDPPPHLTPDALKKWDQLASLLGEMDLLSKADGDFMTLYCDAWARYLEAIEQLAKKDAKGNSMKLLKSKGGHPMLNPWTAERNRASDEMNRYGSELGLSPSARARLRIKPGGSKKQTEKEKRRARFFGKANLRIVG